MGMYYEAYLAYGVRVPDGVNPDDMDKKLRGGPVSYLLAGHYDRDMSFLITECKSVGLGAFETVRPDSFSDEPFAAWDAALTEAAERLGVTPLTEPAWLLIPNLD